MKLRTYRFRGLRFGMGLLACCAALVAQTAAKPDACSPPPGAVAPELPARLLPGMGSVQFKITTSSREAQDFFNQGVAQMHSFWVREAERSFLQAAALDPQAPMPHWGIAMVAAGDFRPGFQLDLVNGVRPKPRKRRSAPSGGEARAIAAANKARELAAVPGKATGIEKLYIEAVAARRDVSAKDANIGYVAGLRKTLAASPNEVEAGAYLALHLMSGFVLPGKTPRPGSMEAVQILRGLLQNAPGHPGVHHFVIHGWEGSTFARDAWPSCERYAQQASNIPHGLHMPGHIYAQTGRWENAATSFASAAANDIYWMKQDSLAGNGHHGHNVHFQASALSFLGRYEEALSAARSLLDYKETPREAKQLDNYRTAWRQGWFAVMRTLVQHEKWDAILDGTTLPAHDKPRERAWRHWALAQARLAKGDQAAARAEAEAMSGAVDEMKKRAGKDAAQPLLIAREELRAQMDLAGGNVERGLRGLEKAAQRELALRYTEPTSYPRPVLEVLGQQALKHGRAGVAEHAYRRALDQYPESAGAKRGLRLALEQRPSGGSPVAGGL